MPDSTRPVDAAMEEERPAKRRIREFWAEEVRLQKRVTEGSLPFYLTLAGSSGLDIQLLIRQKVIEATEVGGIADIDSHRVIAIEKDSLAVLEIQTRFPGLKVIEGDVFDELRGASPITYPTGERKRQFQATVINLDLTRPLTYDNQRESYPQLEAIMKLADLHRISSYIDWRLFLTLQGEINWSSNVQRNVQAFLLEYAMAYPVFGELANKLLGTDIYGAMQAGEDINLAEIPTEFQQKTVSLFVPILLISKLTAQGWRVEVVHSLWYGGEVNVAPMVTWVIRLMHDTSTPLTVANASMAALCTSFAHIDAEGVVSQVT
jgi:hypothetical protein